MPPKNKSQSTMEKIYEYSTMSKIVNVKDISYLSNLTDETVEQFVDDLDKKGQDSGTSSMRRRNTTSKLEFWEERKIKYHWVYSINVVDGKSHMMCKFCEKYKAQAPWGIGKMDVIQFNMMLWQLIQNILFIKHQFRKMCMKL